MALETATYINQLDAANPLGSDPIASGDDHLRLIKSTIKNTFPNITGVVTKTHVEINTAVDQAAAALARSGGTMTGAITLAGNASSDLHAVPRQQVVSLVQAMYPVGSIYINATNATNPNTLLGFGTWVAFGAGRVPVGFDAGNPLFDTAEKTGGSADAVVVSHTHSFSATTSTAGSHSHTAPLYAEAGANAVFADGNTAQPSGLSATTNAAGDHTHTVSGTTAATGSSGTNANYQPFITVYMWKRTA